MSCILWHLVALLRAALRRPPRPKHKVPQGYSPADLPIRAKSGREWGPESAGSLTPIGMTSLDLGQWDFALAMKLGGRDLSLRSRYRKRCTRDIENALLELEISEALRPSILSPSSIAPRRNARLKRSAGFQMSESRAHSSPAVLPDRPGLQNHSRCSGLYKDSFRPFCHTLGVAHC
jgi:hypothetical protein